MNFFGSEFLQMNSNWIIYDQMANENGTCTRYFENCKLLSEKFDFLTLLLSSANKSGFSIIFGRQL